jgi:hypothetical protein
MIFRWTTTVLFFMMTFFVLGIVIVAGVTTNIINRLKRFEVQVQDQGIELGDGLDLSRTQRGFLTFRSLYLKQIKFLAKKAKPGSLEAEVESIPFAKYLEARTRNTLVKFTDVTWQCWLSLLFASSANSVRMFLLPASSQRPGADDYQRLVNHGTFIAILGWIPFLIFLVAVFLLFRRNADYVQSVNASQVRSSETAAGGAPARAGNRNGGASPSVPLLDVELGDSGEGASSKADKVSNVWLPPKQLAGELVGELCEDPSVYLLRSNRGFTLHILKIPTIMIEFYFSIFVVGLWGEMSTKLGLNQIGLLPFALLPVLVIFCFLPHALLVVTVLTSLGCRLDEKELKRLVLRKELKVNAHGSAGGGGGEGDEDGEAEEEEKLNERSRDVKGAAGNGKPGSDGKSRTEGSNSDGGLLQLPDRHGSVGSESMQSQELQSKLTLLRLQLRYLEALCTELGVPSNDVVLDDEQLRELLLEEESGVSTDAPEQLAASVVGRLQRTEGQESNAKGRRFGLAAPPPPLRHAASHGRFSAPDPGAPHPRHVPLPLRLGLGLGEVHSNYGAPSRPPGSPRSFSSMEDLQRGRGPQSDYRNRSGLMESTSPDHTAVDTGTANSMAMLQAVASARQLAANNGAFMLSSRISRRPTVQASALDNIHRAANL